MSETVKKLRKDFADQLNQVTQQIGQLNAQLANAQKQQEQLRGAIFALDVAAQELNKAAAPAAPAAPVASASSDQATQSSDQVAVPSESDQSSSDAASSDSAAPASEAPAQSN